MSDEFGPDTLGVRAGGLRSDFGEHSEALVLTASADDTLDRLSLATGELSGGAGSTTPRVSSVVPHYAPLARSKCPVQVAVDRSSVLP